MNKEKESEILEIVSPDISIIAVDDSATALQVMGNILNDIGFKNVSLAKDGNEAFEKINEKGDVALVLCDWNMPGMTGLELLSKLRSEQKYADLPFVLVTTNSEYEHIKQAAENKVSAYVVKPYTKEVLKEKIVSVLK